MNCFYVIKNNNNLIYVRDLKLDKSPFGLDNDSTYDNAVRFDDKKKAEAMAEKLNKTFSAFTRRKKDVFKVVRVYDRKQDNIDNFDFIRRVVIAHEEATRCIGLALFEYESRFGLYTRECGYSYIYKFVTICGDDIEVSGDLQLNWPEERYTIRKIKRSDVNNLDNTFISQVAKRIREVHKDFIKEYDLD